MQNLYSVQSQYVLDLVDGKKLKRAAARLFSEMFHTGTTTLNERVSVLSLVNQ
jgi:hypothetical protein